MDDFIPSKVLTYCPFCGKHTFHPGVHYLQCDTCGKRLYINAAAAVACIIEDPHGKILLTKRERDPAKGMLDLPGGFVDPGETAEDAVRREIQEELNLQVTDMQYIGTSPNRYLYGGLMYYTLDLGFKCNVSDLSVISAADDVSGFVFLSHDQIDIQQIAFPSIRHIVLCYLEHSRTRR